MRIMVNSKDDDARRWRNEFLLRLYDDLWRSIDRMESGMWQFVALYAVIAGLMISSSQDPVRRSVAVVFSLIVSFWGINVAINAGKWFNRNKEFVVNVEKQFLFREDIGRILPVGYHERKPKVLATLHWIHVGAFLASALVSAWFGWAEMPCVVALIMFLGLVVTGCHYWSARKEVQDFIKGTDPDKALAESVEG